MSNLISLSGRTYGSWLVMDRAPNRKHYTMWNCKCKCGTMRPVYSQSLLNGSSVCCGCVGDVNTSRRSTTHGNSRNGKKTIEYLKWRGAKARCFDEKSPTYHNYGGRGISMCDNWRDSFIIFLNDMGAAPNGGTLERRDVNGNYCPENCVWATKLEQANNKRNTIWVQWLGVKISLANLSRTLKLSYKRLHKLHIRHGLSIEDAVKHINTRMTAKTRALLKQD